MPVPEIVIRTFNDYTETLEEDGKIVPNPYYPDYTYFAHDDMGSLENPHTFLVHSMHVPAEVSPTGEASSDVYDAKNYLESLGFSAHYFIPRGERDEQGRLVVYQMVQDERKLGTPGQVGCLNCLKVNPKLV